jgi:4-amino-4-deoxy-L-arabinose transferase-like glycosyltransferase
VAPAPWTDRRFFLALAVIVSIGFALRVGYTMAQWTSDPWFAHPVIDGRYYVDWASALLGGGPVPSGAFYLAPLYPFFLAAVFGVFGPSFTALYLVQHLLAAASATLIAWAGRPRVGEMGALFAAALFMLHHPLWFFAARPLGETLAIFLLVAALAALWRDGRRTGFLAGLLAGLATVARPNLLLVAFVWLLGETAKRRWSRSALFLAGLTVAILPVTAHNWFASGHLVPVSSNGGITAYHGNGPGAVGVYTHPFGFSYDLGRQREEATRHARARSGLQLDEVEADSWWGRQALKTRLQEPLESVGLFAWRTALTLGNRELGLDYPPALDPNPWRATVRLPGGHETPIVPWALLLGLAATAFTLDGIRGSGGGSLWWAVLACAATPVLFYVSSRYRLPTAALLTLPAGAGLAALIRPDIVPAWRRWGALGVGILVAALSLAVPSGDLYRLQTAESLSNRAQAYLLSGMLDEAEADALRSVEIHPRSVRLWVNLGAVSLAQGRTDEAEAAYRRALEIDLASPEAARGLANVLARSGRGEEGVQVLRRALSFDPRNVGCWNGLVGLLYAGGDRAEARAAVERAQLLGVQLDPELLEAISSGSQN